MNLEFKNKEDLLYKIKEIIDKIYNSKDFKFYYSNAVLESKVNKMSLI